MPNNVMLVVQSWTEKERGSICFVSLFLFFLTFAFGMQKKAIIVVALKPCLGTKCG